MYVHLHPDVAMLAFFQGTQLNLFERFLTQAVSGINSTSITSGMQNVAYVVLLVGFLWQVYQSALHGGDVRGLGNQSHQVRRHGGRGDELRRRLHDGQPGLRECWQLDQQRFGRGNLLENWANDLQTQYSQDGFQQMWGLITGSIAGLIDGILIIVAYHSLSHSSS